MMQRLGRCPSTCKQCAASDNRGPCLRAPHGSGRSGGMQLVHCFVRPLVPQSNAGIQGVSPGNDTVEFLSAQRRRLKLLNAALLASLSLGARAVDAASVALIGLPAGCLSLLLLASTMASSGRQVRLAATRKRLHSPPCTSQINTSLPAALQVEALTRAPAVARLVEREQAAGGQGVLHFPHPESTWC